MVSTDEEAFKHIRGRLEGDVGGIFKLINSGAMHTPFWSMVRLTFPVAEAVADLIHNSTSPHTAERLRLLLGNELETVRPGYKKIAATITLLYRHALTH